MREEILDFRKIINRKTLFVFIAILPDFEKDDTIEWRQKRRLIMEKKTNNSQNTTCQAGNKLVPILGILAAALLALSIFLFTNLQTVKSEHQALTKKYEKYSNEYKTLSNKYFEALDQLDTVNKEFSLYKKEMEKKN